MKVYFVGAGPGDPNLITVKGLKLIERADVLVYADSLVNEELLKAAKPTAKKIKAAGMHLEATVDLMVKAVNAGKMVLRLHSGDPALYGAIAEQIALLKVAGIAAEIVPGVSSVFAGAAAAGVELTIPGLTQTVILTRVAGRTPVPPAEELASLARHHCTMAIFLSATLTQKIVSQLLTAGWAKETPALVVYRATWPDEKIIRTTVGELHAAVRKNKIHRQALILVGAALSQNIDREGYRSLLYDSTFTHGWRPGISP